MTEVYYSAKHWAKKAEEWASQAAGVTSFNGRIGTVTLISADVTGALGYTPYNSTNPSGYITGITSAMVTTALGYTPYNSSNPSGYISGITSAMVTTALGYTPYDATNPAGYTTNVGTVTSVNNVSPVNGNVTLSIPTVYDSTITIQKNGTNVDSFTTNASSNKSINITVPTQASDVNALPSSTKYGADLSLTSGTLQLLDQDGNNLGNSVSLPDPSLKANVGLDNLTSTGKNIGNWSSNVTNCIINIPQDIKLELNNGTLTLKAGSKVYVPNGFESDGTTPKFDAVTFQNDVLCYTGYTTATERLMTYLDTQEQIQGVNPSYFYSGDTTKMNSTTAYDYARFYNTTTNKIYRGNSSNVWVEVYQSLPIAIATNDSSGKYTLNQIFNGFGYMGSTVFVLPGVKGLIPNGKNSDGTQNSVEYTVQTVITRTFSSGTARKNQIGVQSNGTSVVSNGFYLKEDGYLYDSNNNKKECFVFGNYTVISSVVDSIKTKDVFQSLDYNDSFTTSILSMPSNKYDNLTLGTSGSTYTAPANGWFYLRRKTTSTNQNVGLTNATAMIELACFVPQSNSFARCFCPAKKGDVITVYYNAGGGDSSDRFRFIYAEGEV